MKSRDESPDSPPPTLKRKKAAVVIESSDDDELQSSPPRKKVAVVAVSAKLRASTSTSKPMASSKVPTKLAPARKRAKDDDFVVSDEHSESEVDEPAPSKKPVAVKKSPVNPKPAAKKNATKSEAVNGDDGDSADAKPKAKPKYVLCLFATAYFSLYATLPAGLLQWLRGKLGLLHQDPSPYRSTQIPIVWRDYRSYLQESSVRFHAMK